MDTKGQISIEFILVIAVMLVLVLLIGSIAGGENESNNVLSAARSGATNAVSDLSFLNESMEPVRVNDMKVIGTGHDLTIQINVSGPLSVNQTESVINGTLNSIATQGYTHSDAGTPDISDDYITTSTHKYTVTIT